MVILSLEERVREFARNHRGEYESFVKSLEEFGEFQQRYKEFHRGFMNEVVQPEALQRANLWQQRGEKLTDHQAEHNVREILENALRILEKDFPLFVKAFRVAHKLL